MTLTYWSNYSKKKNSTAQPTSGTDVTIALKDDCSIINPVIRSATMPASVNYCYISEWGRYYFVTNCVYISNTVKEFTLEVDVLASYKAAIGSTVARIGFASTGWNKDIIDNRISVSTSKKKYQKSVSTALSATGTYILTVFNDDPVGGNGIGMSYAMEEADIIKVKQWMSDPDVLDALQQFFMGDPIESIFGCIWVPFPFASVPSVAGVSSIHIGNQSSADEGFTINAKILSGSGLYNAAQLTLSGLPFEYNDFRDAEPYSSWQIYLPGIGYTNLNIGDWLDTVDMKIDMTMEYGSGDIIYYLKDFNGYTIQTASCNAAYQCPMGQETLNGSGIVSGLGGVVGGIGTLVIGAATENPALMIGGAGALIASAANIAVSANKRATSLKGGGNGRAITDQMDILLTGFFMDTEDCDDVNYIAKKGRPVAETHTISTHSGFIQCDNASVSCSGTALEKDRINEYLNTGFYYE